MQFANQHIVIVGGSQGIGFEVARAAINKGANVTIIGRSAAKLDAAAKQLSSVRTIAADIEDENAIADAFRTMPAPNHVYVAAGQFIGGSIMEGELSEFKKAFDARIWGAVSVVRAAAPKMSGPKASFVFTGGVSSDRPVKGAWPTAVATAAAEQLARALTVELSPLRFNAIAPGWTDTPMWDAILGANKAATFAEVSAKIPTGQMALATEAADAVLLMMANSAINGEILHVDGGHRLA
jgi:NAD(P)-dependent dehydrogenase (short-subunit alcohol dehydrogenase family)